MTIDNNIHLLIAKFVSGEALPEDAMELENWMNQSPENAAYFNTHAKIFNLNTMITHYDKNLAWKNIGNAINTGKTPSQLKMMGWWLAGIAASVAIVFWIALPTTQLQKNESDLVIYQAKERSQTILLKDSSEIIVQPHSSITLNKEYGAGNSKIALTGSASFSIVHNPSRALVVDVHTLHIKDIGTRFSVLSSPLTDTVFITVTEGKISVYDDFSAPQNAAAGENVWYIKSTKKMVVFRARQDTVITPPKPIKIAVEPIKPTVVAKAAPIAPADTVAPYHYPAVYPLDSGYTNQGKNEIKAKEAVASARIVTDLVGDGLITRGQPLQFTLSDTAFILNGKKQSGPVFERYKQKYGGKAPGPWSWSHAENQPPK